jgi:hypothetical protein
MRNKLWFLAGIASLLVALYLAVPPSNQDRIARPQAAVALATAFHVTPSPRPTPAITPKPLPTPLLYTLPTPTPLAILDMLFHSPYRGASIAASPERMIVRTVHTYYLGQDEIVVAGDRATATAGNQVLPAAFGAILVWDHGRYVVGFEHVEVDEIEAWVSMSITPETGQVQFLFRDGGPGKVEAANWHTYLVECLVDSCQVINSPAGP